MKSFIMNNIDNALQRMLGLENVDFEKDFFLNLDIQHDRLL